MTSVVGTAARNKDAHVGEEEDEGHSDALTLAVVDGDEERVQAVLLEGECDVNGTDGMGLWPLLAAIKCQNSSMARLLIDHGATINTTSTTSSELHALADAQKGPFPPLPASLGAKWASTLQGWAKPSALIKLWQMLIAAGASPVAPDHQGTTPFHLACARGNWPAVQFLLQGKHIGVHIDVGDKRGESALHYAARYGRVGVLSLLLASRADKRVHGAQGDAAEVARKCGHVEAADLIESWSYRVCPMQFMPYEVLLHVMALLEPHDLCSVAQVCTALNGVSSDDQLWRRFCSSHSLRGATSTRCKEHYMSWLQPRLKQYSEYKSKAVVPAAAAASSSMAPASAGYPDYLFKFVLVGDAGVGKTALHVRFIDQSFSNQVNYSCSVDFRIKYVDVGGRRLKLQVWDTMGQERFRSITRAYYRGAHGMLVVYDITVRASWENVRRWVVDVRGALPEDQPMIPFILVGAKSDMTSQRQVSVEEGEALAEELGAVGWAETSSLTGANVEETFHRLSEVVLLGLNPFANRSGGGFHSPSEDLLLRLYAKSSGGLKAAAKRNSESTKCILQ